MTGALSRELKRLWEDGQPVCLVRIVEARGSTPAPVGALMLVTPQKSAGTIGGGWLEWQALDHARKLLLSPQTPNIQAAQTPSTQAAQTPSTREFTLGRKGGQCCGGQVTLLFARAGAEDSALLAKEEERQQADWPWVFLYGSGHVGQALARALRPLPFLFRWFDCKKQEIAPDMGLVPEITSRLTATLTTAPLRTAFIIMTHSHSLDYLLTAAALARPESPYVGLIGSHTKRRRFESALRAQEMTDEEIARLHCPLAAEIAAPRADKTPAVIAALTAAELIAFCLPAKPPKREGDKAAVIQEYEATPPPLAPTATLAPPHAAP